MRTILPIIFLAIFLAFISGAIIYMSRRMNFFFDTVSLRTWYSIFIFLAIFMMGGLMAFSNTTNEMVSFLYQASAVTMGFLLYFLMIMLGIDLLNLILKLPHQITGIVVIGLTSILVIGGIINSFNIRTTPVNIELESLNKPIKAVHLSDIHIGHFRGEKWMQEIVDKTNAENPDIIFITGDLFDGRINLSQETLSPVKNFTAPVYFVEGNHDNYSGVSVVKKYLRNLGVRVLENEVEVWNDIQIVGFNHTRADSSSSDMHMGQGKTMKEIFPTLHIDQNLPAIFLHHSPDGIEYANQYGIDLYLSGHTHGGQQFPVTLINELLFKYNRGLDEYKETKILVSEGVGTFGPPLRIGTKSEIISLNLIPVKK